MGWCCNGFGWRGGWGAWGGFGILGSILSLVFFVGLLIVLVLGIIWLMRQLQRRAPAVNGADALDIARRKLAAGEITVAEFDEVRDRLRS